MGIKEPLYGVCFQGRKASHLGKKLLLPGLLDNMLYELDMQNPQKKMTAEFSKTRWKVLLGFLPHEEVCQTFCRTQRKK